MNSLQALAIAAAGLVMAGEPITAPFARVHCMMETSIAHGRAVSHAMISAAATEWAELTQSSKAEPHSRLAQRRRVPDAMIHTVTPRRV